MKERPILFSGEMVRAILGGRKSQTRRVVKKQDTILHLAKYEEISVWQVGEYYPYLRWNFGKKRDGSQFGGLPFLSAECPYGQPGDRLWVRETWTNTPYGPLYRASVEDNFQFVDPPYVGCRWRPSIFMPRKVSRIMLEVVKVRVERAQDISHNDACVEGAPSEPELNNYGTGSIYVDWYAQLWDKINAKRGYGWKVNPWVWVVEFEKVG
jgi:hypothetical protein